MRIIFVLIISLFLFSCSESSEHENKVVDEKNSTKSERKIKNQSMEGYQDTIKRANDMQKQIDKSAKEKKQIIDDLDE